MHRAVLTLLLVFSATAHGAGWELPWGSGPGQVGRDPGGGERGPRGPQSFAVDARGTLFVADTINERVLAISAGSARVVTSAAPADLALCADGEVTGVKPHLRAFSRVACGAAADEARHQLVLFDGATPRATLPYESYGLALDPRGRVVTPRFQTLSGFVLARAERDGRALPSLPFDLASPLAIDLLDVDDDGAALALVPLPAAPAGTQQLMHLEPGGRARELWRGVPPDAARSVVRGRDGRVYRASLTPKAWVVQPVAVSPSPPATSAGKVVLRVAASAIGRPVALLALGTDALLVGEDGRWARGLATGRLDAPHRPLFSVVRGPGDEVWALAEARPEVHRYDARALRPLGRLTLAGWARAPDVLTVSPEGQVLTCDRATAQWIKHDARGAEVLRFDQASAGALDRRSELITVNDTEEPFTKAVLEFDSNGNFFKVIATIQEKTRPTCVRFLGNAPGGDLLVGYWLGARFCVRRYTIDGAEKPGWSFDLPSAARVACADVAVDGDGKTMIATREGRDLVVRSFSN